MELQRARVLEVNRHLATLTDSWERGGLPLHMNLAVHHHNPDMLNRLKQQNHLLTEVKIYNPIQPDRPTIPPDRPIGDDPEAFNPRKEPNIYVNVLNLKQTEERNIDECIRIREEKAYVPEDKPLENPEIKTQGKDLLPNPINDYTDINVCCTMSDEINDNLYNDDFVDATKSDQNLRTNQDEKQERDTEKRKTIADFLSSLNIIKPKVRNGQTNKRKNIF